MGASFSTLTESSPSMYTVVSWITIGSAVVLVWFLSQKKTTKSLKVVAQPKTTRQLPQKHKEPKEKVKQAKQAVKTTKESAKQVPAPNKAPKQTSEAATVSATKKATHKESSDEGIDNREFARLFAGVQQGTKLQGPKQSAERQKSVKQSKAREVDGDNPSNKASVSGLSAPSVLSAPSASSGPSSTAGVDADDDASPITSPPLKATEAGDITDMLEHAQNEAAPVLRLTGTDKVTQKPKSNKVPEKVETKKQRQNRKKAEAAKAQREKDEQERKALLETQRRTARIAEGRAAKDGSLFTAAQTHSSVWDKSNGVNGTSGTVPSNGVPNGENVSVHPLDTFNANKGVISTKSSSTTTSSAPQSTDKGDWLGALPSEEEQMEMLRGEEEWSIVETKKSKRNNRAESTGESDAASAADNFKKVPSTSAAKLQVQPRASPVNGKDNKPRFSQQSSFAALSTENTNIEEEEWDV